VLLGLLEFFLINWLGQHSISSGYYQIGFIQSYEDAPLFNIVFRVLAPSVFLVLTAAAWYALGADELVVGYWRVTLYYVGVRWMFNLGMGRGALLRWGNQVAVAVLAIGLSYVVYRGFLVDRAAVLPSARALVDELWIVVIIFIYHTYRQMSSENSEDGNGRRRTRYIKGQYLRLRRRFHEVVEANSPSRTVEALAYSVMIYETFNRPTPFQLIERYVLFPLRLAKSLGPMQVRTDAPLPDAELVGIGIRKLGRDLEASVREEARESPYASIRARRNNEDGTELPFESGDNWDHLQYDEIGPYAQQGALKRTLAKYNVRSDYPDQVLGILGILREEMYRDLMPEW
jgi:hypothetical protein